MIVNQGCAGKGCGFNADPLQAEMHTENRQAHYRKKQLHAGDKNRIAVAQELPAGKIGAVGMRVFVEVNHRVNG
ncbi:hypothetical protein MASR1M12_37950 [Erysipelotrichia bacterium]